MICYAATRLQSPCRQMRMLSCRPLVQHHRLVVQCQCMVLCESCQSHSSEKRSENCSVEHVFARLPY